MQASGAFGSKGNLWHITAREQVTADSADALPSAVDLLIIGGGFTGLSAALEAARMGAKVALLEAQEIGHGGSGRNVGLVNAGLWLPPQEIIKTLGVKTGEALIDTLGAAPARVFDLIARENIACEATRNGTLHLAHNAAGLNDLKTRHRQGNQYGAPLQLLDAEETAARTGSPNFAGALFDPRAGTIQPLTYARGLARAAQAAGAQIFAPFIVEDLTYQGRAWVARAAGREITAQSALIATNAYHMTGFSSYRPSFIPVCYSQFATTPLPQSLRTKILAGGEGAWDTAMVMSSFRMDAAGRLILGAIGNVEGRLGGGTHHAWAARKLAQTFPQLTGQGFSHIWQGRIAMTGDHIPKVLEIGPNGAAVFGYSGRGIGPGTVFGTAAAQALLQQNRNLWPMPPRQKSVTEFGKLRGAFYELGAIIAHALQRN